MDTLEYTGVALKTKLGYWSDDMSAEELYDYLLSQGAEDYELYFETNGVYSSFVISQYNIEIDRYDQEVIVKLV